MNSAVLSMLERYQCTSIQDYENALKEIIQEVALLGLWRSKFFDHAAFYGGTSLRILYGLDRFSEDLDFSLLAPNQEFDLQPHLKAVQVELEGMGFNATVEEKEKTSITAIESAFIKASTKEHLLRIAANPAMTSIIHRNKLLHIKLEIDTNPPAGFETEAKFLLQPIPFSVCTYKLPDLFAGKLHAILQRGWKGRVKGRDFYDFVWYIGRAVPVRLHHLEQRLRQSGGWQHSRTMTLADLERLLQERFAGIDFSAAKKDVEPFVKDHASLALWSSDFFVSLLSQLQAV